MSQARKLKDLLKGDRMVIAPGSYDCITAMLIEQAGFEAVYMTGAGTAASFGYPDFGLVTQTEMSGNAGRIANALNVPLIADADTGYGNELNVYRTVREYERLGVAAIHLEDQDFPKKCGHLDNKVIIPREDYFAKIRAAAAARRSPDFTIIARTDSRAVAGFDEAIARANGALAAGAELIFVEAPQSIEEIELIPKLVKGPCMLNIVAGGKTPAIPLARIEQLGFKLSILPGVLFRNIITMCDETLRSLKETGEYPAETQKSPRETFRRFGADEWDGIRTRYREPVAEAAE